MTEHPSSSSDGEALSSSIDGTFSSDPAADALSARLETITSHLARIRAELAELRACERGRRS